MESAEIKLSDDNSEQTSSKHGTGEINEFQIFMPPSLTQERHQIIHSSLCLHNVYAYSLAFVYQEWVCHLISYTHILLSTVYPNLIWGQLILHVNSVVRYS
jgi:hypothetical protein